LGLRPDANSTGGDPLFDMGWQIFFETVEPTVGAQPAALHTNDIVLQHLGL
jgi:hypothetical protein